MSDPNNTELSEFGTNFYEHQRAGYQCVLIPTAEETRVELELQNVAQVSLRRFVTWDVNDGFVLSTSNPAEQEPMNSITGDPRRNFCNPLVALRAIAEPDILPKNCVLVMRDIVDFFADATIRRALRSLITQRRIRRGKTADSAALSRIVVLVSPKRELHHNLRSDVSIIEFDLPGEASISERFEYVRKSISDKNPEKAVCSDELREQAVACMAGLTSVEAENALIRAVVHCDAFTPGILDLLKREKAEIVKKGEVLTYIPETSSAERNAIGGYDNLLSFVDRRCQAYSREARAINLDYPKGISLLGLPGTGKSMVAKSICRMLGVPGFILDIGALFGSLVGESEMRTREVIRQVEAQRGCVLVIDEVDKAFANALNSSGDSGVTQRIFGRMLTWLADKQDRTFVVMTMNRAEGLPPEFLRPGRIDKVFWVDLPNSTERRTIMNIHFRKRGVDPTTLGLSEQTWTTLIDEKLDNYAGAELEEVVKEARYLSWENRKNGDPNQEELFMAAASVRAMAVSEPVAIRQMREWGSKNATPVTIQRVTEPVPAALRRRAVDMGNN